MRQWTPSHGQHAVHALEGLIGLIGEPGFEAGLLPHLRPLVPAASYAIYRTGQGCAPQLFMSASLEVPDTTRECWRAYLCGPYATDRSLGQETSRSGQTRLCHITAQEVAPEHRARVYEAHGVAERVSAVTQEGGAIFAVNFYRHAHQPPFSDGHLGAFEALAPSLVALAKKHITLRHAQAPLQPDPQALARRLTGLCPQLTPREVDVCVRMLQGLTHDGIASDLGLGLPTVKTYRNRAFGRLGIHHRNELFARVMGSRD